MPVVKYFVMKTFKFKTQILIICFGLIAYGDSALETRIGSDGREYLIDGDNKYTWFQAFHQCARRNRELLTIDSAEKQDVINKLLDDKRNDYLWLGANDEFNPSGDTDRTFFWSATGKQFTCTNWAENNPDNIDDRNCVLIYLGNKKWVNYKCGDKNGFVCEEKPKQSVESCNKNPNNASDVVQKLFNDFDLKFQSLLKDNMAQLNGQLENIKQVDKDTNYEVEKLTNITRKILNKQEISTNELNHEITKLGSDLSDQQKRIADELNAKLNEKQNFTYPSKNIVLIKNSG